MAMRTPIAFLLLCLSLPASAAEVYKWTDRNGQVHYADRPRPGAEALDVKPASGDGGAAADREKDEAARAARCKLETEELDRARKATGLRETDSKGKSRDLSADERTAYIAGIEKRVTNACAGVPAPTAPAPAQ